MVVHRARVDGVPAGPDAPGRTWMHLDAQSDWRRNPARTRASLMALGVRLAPHPLAASTQPVKGPS